MLGCCLLAILAACPTAAWAQKKSKEDGKPKSTSLHAVTLAWSCAGTADVYVNGRPVLAYKQDFLSRGDETGAEFTAEVDLKVGDTITVGARRSRAGVGFRLVALDSAERAVWQTEVTNWKAYVPRDVARWFSPSTVAASPLGPVAVPSKDFPPPTKHFGNPKTDFVDHIWFKDANQVFLAAKVTARRGLASILSEGFMQHGGVQYMINKKDMSGLRPGDLDGTPKPKHYKGPLELAYYLTDATDIHGVVVEFTQHKGPMTWHIECAANRKDLAAKKGTYRQVTPQQVTQSDQTVDLLWKPINAACWQLVAKKDGDGGIVVKRFELLAPP